MKIRSIRDGWKLRPLEPAKRLGDDDLQEAAKATVDAWLKIESMPAMVHDVLLSHGAIETPWLPGRAEACKWVAEKDWLYAVRFFAPEARAEGKRWVLRFKGLDTVVDVYLNGEPIASSFDMHRELSVDVSGRLAEDNALALHFRSVFDVASGEIRRLSCVDDDPARPIIRPGVNYTTYLGPHPYFSHVGVFGDTLLEEADEASLDECFIGASVDEDLRRGCVHVQAAGYSRAAETWLKVRAFGPDGSKAAASEIAIASGAERFAASAELAVAAPQLWWPRGYGDQPLYRIEISLFADGQEAQRETRRIGFRRVSMRKLFHFEVNNKPVRLWGGNWAALDWATTVWDQDRAARLFDIAENANFNAFRIWGVNEAPADGLYDLADERGFMLWQDFHGMRYSPDAANRQRCREGAAEQIKRLKHHPSILMWCGGNEAAMWHEHEFGGPGGPWPGKVVAEDDLGAVCAALDPDRYYHPNSPYLGIDANDPQLGDTHGYTNIWFVPGYDYLVFASEDTRISAPPMHSLKRFIAPEHLWPEEHSPLWTHGKILPWPDSWMNYTTSQSWKKCGPIETLHDAVDAESLVYRLGMGAALYYQDVVERQRRGRSADDPSAERRCGGYLAWKYNDSWPEIYSAKVDYFLEPYLAYYALKRAYAPLLLSFESGSRIWLWAVNDGVRPIEGTVKIDVFQIEKNEIIASIAKSIRVEPDQSVIVSRLDRDGIGTFRRECVLFASLSDREGRILARASALSDLERNYVFPDARIEAKRKDGAIVLTTDKFARSVFLTGDADGDGFGWLFEDNWFDLVPGESKVVRVLGRHDKGRIVVKPFFSPHATTLDWLR